MLADVDGSRLRRQPWLVGARLPCEVGRVCRTDGPAESVREHAGTIHTNTSSLLSVVELQLEQPQPSRTRRRRQLVATLRDPDFGSAYQLAIPREPAHVLRCCCCCRRHHHHKLRFDVKARQHGWPRRR